jgi:hypothetical protein
VSVALADLEKDKPVSSYHVQLDPHTACYYVIVYSYLRDKRDRSEPGPMTQISYCFYPIISSSHPFSLKLKELETRYGSLDKVPANAQLPRIEKFAVLIKTRRFVTVGDLPSVPIQAEGSIPGLVLNELAPLNSEEEALIRKRFPNIDFNNVLIVEEGREPASPGRYFGLMGGGIVVFLLSIVVASVTRRQRKY